MAEASHFIAKKEIICLDIRENRVMDCVLFKGFLFERKVRI
jgi:hypothetical protein